MGIGESAALTAACCWAVASMFYCRIPLSAWAINLSKNVFTSIVLLVHLSIVAAVSSRPIFSASGSAWGWLMMSGIVGIALGDTFYFRSLQILGPRRGLVVATMAPLFGALVGWLWLDETLGMQEWLGIAITLSAIIAVVSEDQQQDESPGLYPASSMVGFAYGTLASICTSMGGALSKVGMADCDPLEATFIRIIVCVPLMALFAMGKGKLREVASQSLKPANLKWFVPAALSGTWIGIWLSQVAYKFSDIAIALTLLTTSPLFAIPMVALFLRQRVSWRAILATIIAVVGVGILVSA
ncbi:MAG: hypothetical protein CMJ78_03570 [Planctomycetaceae bacterium]|nr:hypothetical protein [Planctomycetaceae bacterium]